MKKNKYLNVSISLSILSIAITLFINIRIAREFLRSDGKTRALFGLKEILLFSYQYDVCLLGLISLVIVLLNIKGDDQKGKVMGSILSSVFAVIVVFMRIWRLWV